jgi:tRNA 2-thiouridine synthesizing protein B
LNPDSLEKPTMLHTINKAPHANCFADCLRVCDAGAAVLLIEDGVLAAIAGSAAAAQLRASGCRVYVLLPDAQARGIAERIDSDMAAVDYAGFVQLCSEHAVVQSWY